MLGKIFASVTAVAVIVFRYEFEAKLSFDHRTVLKGDCSGRKCSEIFNNLSTNEER